MTSFLAQNDVFLAIFDKILKIIPYLKICNFIANLTSSHLERGKWKVSKNKFDDMENTKFIFEEFKKSYPISIIVFLLQTQHPHTSKGEKGK